MVEKHAFSSGDFVVYPTHGVGKVVYVVTETIAGFELKLYVINFAAEKMTLRVPVNKAEDSGLRKISSREKMQTAMSTRKGRARSKRTMWSRRAQEYEAKINSGDPVAIAEVVRDLHRAPDQPDQSYSERQMYEAALNRLAHELALGLSMGAAAALQFALAQPARVRSAMSRTTGTVRSALANPPAPVVSWPMQPHLCGQVSSRCLAAWPPIRSWSRTAAAPSRPSSRSAVHRTVAGCP